MEWEELHRLEMEVRRVELTLRELSTIPVHSSDSEQGRENRNRRRVVYRQLADKAEALRYHINLAKEDQAPPQEAA